MFFKKKERKRKISCLEFKNKKRTERLEFEAKELVLSSRPKKIVLSSRPQKREGLECETKKERKKRRSFEFKIENIENI